ncbi:unnamed protein product [Lathyrus sativus]|nr:unnamed protein product [Lathyrus sativus]
MLELPWASNFVAGSVFLSFIPFQSSNKVLCKSVAAKICFQMHEGLRKWWCHSKCVLYVCDDVTVVDLLVELDVDV